MKRPEPPKIERWEYALYIGAIAAPFAVVGFIGWLLLAILA